jgi:sugar lactone lactonase YvrE
MDSRRALTVLMAVAAAVAAAAMPSPASAQEPPKTPVVHELATFAAPGCVGGCGSGSTIGPDKALYVTDGPGGRVLRVDPKTGGNIVPTGLDVHGTTIYMGQAGPIPHLPQDGKVVKFTPTSAATEVASGASLIVDVEFGSCRQLYALSQGIWDLPPIPENEGAPASPDTGRLVRVRKDGSFTPVAEGLDRPTSLEFSRRTAFAITLTGKVIRIDNAGRPPIG